MLRIISYIFISLTCISNSVADQIPATFLGWYDYGYSVGKLTMPPTGNGREQDWHNKWPGHPNMSLSPAVCTSPGQVLLITCPNNSCGGGFTCRSDYSCPEGTINLNNGYCELRFVLGIPISNPNTQCSAGNPVDISTGTKIQKETDIYSRGINQVGFDRTYNNGRAIIDKLWFDPYQKSLQVIEPQESRWIREKSSAYTSKEQACSSGWNEIKLRISDNWVQGAVAEYINGTCQIVRNNLIVKNIPIIPDGSETGAYIKPSFIQLVRENGSILSFGLDSNSQYRGFGGERGRLTSISDSASLVWRFRTDQGDVEDYDTEGKLISITASNGMKQELFYDVNTGLLSRVEDSTGRELVFAYSGTQISSVTVDGDKVTSYTYNNLGVLTQVTRPDNSIRIYHYENTNFPTALTGITDERGVRYATWTYDDQGRAISSEHAGGTDKTLLAFNADGSTTVTNPLGKQTTYHFADIAGARRVTQVEGHATASCEGANQNYTYTSEGWIESKTDWKGNTTTFSYNTLGQEISRTEAFGTPDARTITTEWHPDFYVKTRLVEGGKETRYTYDDNGRLLSTTTNPLPIQ